MSRTVVLELDDADYEQLLMEAQAAGQKLEEMAARRLRHRPNVNAIAHSETADLDAQSSFNSPTVNEPVHAYPDYPGFEALRPEVQEVACALSARNGGTADYHARLWWNSLTPRPLSDISPQAQADAEQAAMRHFGTFHSGDPNSGDNERIDADLTRYYVRELDGNKDDA